MAITLDKDAEDRLLSSVKRYFREELDQEIGDLKAKLLLRFILKEIGPCIYNRAVGDVHAHLRDVIDEVDAVCFEPELGFWKT